MSEQANVDTARKPKRRRRALRLVLLAVGIIVGVPGGGYLYQFYILGNFHTVIPGEVYRSAQPSPSRLAGWTRQYGLKSVLCLTRDTKLWPGEQAEATQLGLQLVRVPIKAEKDPPGPEIRQIIGYIESLPRPLLIHCGAGADRTGLVSVMAAMAVGGQDYDTARHQLTWKAHHVPYGPAKAMDEFFARYENWCAANGKPRGNWPQFREWAETVYSAEAASRVPARPGASPGQVVRPAAGTLSPASGPANPS